MIMSKRTFCLLRLFISALTVVLTLVAVYAFSSLGHVPSSSMEPTFYPNDIFLYRRTNKVEQGDCIVFHPYDLSIDSVQYLKRVIAMEGDHLSIHDGQVFLNGRVLDEPYLHGAATPGELSDTVIQPGMMFFMGDNRSNSVDSRYLGCVPVNRVIGVVWFTF